jgi:hypothetical protein
MHGVTEPCTPEAMQSLGGNAVFGGLGGSLLAPNPPQRQHEEKKSLTICLPIASVVDARFMQNFLQLFADAIDSYILRVNFSRITPLDAARNYLFQSAVTDDSNYTLWIDSDILPPQGCVDRLVRAIDEGHPVVSGLYFSKGDKHEPVVRQYRESAGSFYQWPLITKFDGLVKVDGVGFGLVMMDRNTMRAVNEYTKGTPFDFTPVTNKLDGTSHTVSEDLTFCLKLRDLGIPIVLDTSMICGHVGGIVDEKAYIYASKAKNGGIA